MQGPRQVPPGRRSLHRPPPGARQARTPDRRFPGRRDARREAWWSSRQKTEKRPLPAPPAPPTHWLYLHGFGSSPHSQKARFFQQRFDAVNLPLVVPDLNVPSFERLTISSALQAIGEVIAALPGDATIGIIGSSLGGLLALFAADRHPQVRRLLLMAPALGLFRSNFVGLGQMGMRKWERMGYVEVYHYGTDSMRRISYDFVQDARQYDEGRLNLTIPISIVHGSRDETVDPRLSILYAKRRPNVRLHLVDDDHALIASCTQIWEWLWRDIRPTQGGESGK